LTALWIGFSCLVLGKSLAYVKLYKWGITPVSITNANTSYCDVKQTWSDTVCKERTSQANYYFGRIPTYVITIMIDCVANKLLQYRNVTDGRTDKPSDGQTTLP